MHIKDYLISDISTPALRTQALLLLANAMVEEDKLSATGNIEEILPQITSKKSNRTNQRAALGSTFSRINDSLQKSNSRVILTKTRTQYTFYLNPIDKAIINNHTMRIVSDNPLYHKDNYQPAEAATPEALIFVSFSDKGDNASDNDDFLQKIKDALAVKRRPDLRDGLWYWKDHTGNNVDQRIAQSLKQCRMGLILCSQEWCTAAQDENHLIGKMEFPTFHPQGGKPSVVVMMDSLPINDAINGLQIDPLDYYFHRYQKQGFIQLSNQEGKKAFAREIADQIIKTYDNQPDTNNSNVKKKIENLKQFDDPRYQREKAVRNQAVEVNFEENSKNNPTKEKGEKFYILEELQKWAKNIKDTRIFALLGDLGSGKTFNCRMLAQDLIDDNSFEKYALYIDLRDVLPVPENIENLTLDWIFKGWINHHSTEQNNTLTIQDIKQILPSAIVIMDGFDEVSNGLKPEQSHRFLLELLRVVQQDNNAKLLVSCRTHYFPSIREQNATLFDNERGTTQPLSHKKATPKKTDSRTTRTVRAAILLPFNEKAVREYLGKCGLSSEAVEDAMTLFSEVHNLQELSTQPYLLARIKDQIERLEQMRATGKTIYAIDIYHSLVEKWLARDKLKHIIEPDHKLELMQQLACSLWRSKDRQISKEKLHQFLFQYVIGNPVFKYRYEHKTESIFTDFHNASFIIRRGDSFVFAHTSLQEYFIAECFIREIENKQAVYWNQLNPSTETLQFLAQGLQQHPEQHTLYNTLNQWAKEGNNPRTLLRLAQTMITQDITPFSLQGLQAKDCDLSNLHIGQQQEPEQSISPLLDISDSRFARCQLSHSRWWGVNLNNVHFSECFLASTEWLGNQINGANWQQCQHLKFSTLRHCQGQINSPEKPKNFAHPTHPPSEKEASSFFCNLGHSAAVNYATFSPDGENILTASHDNSARLWDKNGNLIKVLEGHSGSVSHAAFSHDGENILTASRDNSARLWDKNGNLIKVLEGHSNSVHHATFSHDGENILTQSIGMLKIWKLNRTSDKIQITNPLDIYAHLPRGGYASVKQQESKHWKIQEHSPNIWRYLRVYADTEDKVNAKSLTLDEFAELN